MAEKAPLILFSGGLDSTYLVYKHLLETEGPIDLLSITGIQYESKVKIEKDAQLNILEYFRVNRDKYKGRIRTRYEADVDVTRQSSNYSLQKKQLQQDRFGQVMTWLMGGTRVINSDIHTSLQVAYVNGDQICTDTQKLKWGWTYITEVTMRSPVDLEFPLLDYSKQHILKVMPRELIDLTWHCEVPRYVSPSALETTPHVRTVVLQGVESYYTQCQKCPACVRWAKEIFEFRFVNGDIDKDRFSKLPDDKKVEQDEQIKDSNDQHEVGLRLQDRESSRDIGRDDSGDVELLEEVDAQPMAEAESTRQNVAQVSG